MLKDNVVGFGCFLVSLETRIEYHLHQTEVVVATAVKVEYSTVCTVVAVDQSH
jgi:hypothetical protein